MSSMNYNMGAYYPVNTQFGGYGGYAANNQRFLGAPANVPITGNQYLYGSSYKPNRYNLDSPAPTKQDTTNTLLKLLLNILTDKNETESDAPVATPVATIANTADTTATVTTPDKTTATADKVETTSVNNQEPTVKELLIKLLTKLTNNSDSQIPTLNANTANQAQNNSNIPVYPKPLSDPLGGQIPTNNGVIQDGLFGNFHGTTSILSRYVGDTMPTNKDAPGYTWKYTLPGA